MGLPVREDMFVGGSVARHTEHKVNKFHQARYKMDLKINFKMTAYSTFSPWKQMYSYKNVVFKYLVYVQPLA